LSDYGAVWEMSGSFIIAHSFSGVYAAFLDESAAVGNHSYFNFTGDNGLGSWDAEISADGSFEGEWGIRANITFESANVTYSVYRDEFVSATAIPNYTMIVSGLTDNSYIDVTAENNTAYQYVVSAAYSDGEVSGMSNMDVATPQSNTVHEESYNDGTGEAEINAYDTEDGVNQTGNYVAVKFMANAAGEDLIRFKWYQTDTGGAFYLRVWEDDGGLPGSQIYSTIVASGLVNGWNEKDISAAGVVVSGDFWIGVKEFTSTSPFGVDTDSDAGVSFYSNDDWATANPIAGNVMFHVFLDEGENAGDCVSSDFGDVTEDGNVNVLDIVTIVNFIMGVNDPTAYEQCAGDVNEDGDINVLDIVSIVNIIMGN